MFNANMIAETRKVEKFQHLKLRDDSGGSVVYIEQGEAEGLRIEASREQLGRVMTEVHDGVLHIRLGGTWLERLGDKLATSLTRPKIIYHLQVKDIRSVDLLCASGLYIESLTTDVLSLHINGFGHAVVRELNLNRLILRHSGVGTLEFAGRATHQDVTLSGTGMYSALGLQSEHALLSISGSARASVNVSESLDATIRGMGVVEYRGSPSVRRRILGMGNVVHIG